MKSEMKDKVLSAIIWGVIGFVIVYGVSYYVSYSSGTSTSGTRGTRSLDPKSMSDAQLERMATRLGISKEELKKKIDAWEDIRDLMKGTKASWSGTMATGASLWTGTTSTGSKAQ